jgi:hypothetical protein
VRCILAVVVVVASVGWSASATAQLRIVNYNVNASDPAIPAIRAGMDNVLQAINASAKGGFARPIDVLVMQEAASVATTGTAFAGLLNTLGGGTSYLRSTVDASTTGSGRPVAVYNSAAVTLVNEKRIGSISGTASHPRQTMRYQFRPVGYDSTADFYVYASHFKASSDCAMASAAGMVRDLSATTTASTSAASGEVGTPMVCTTRMPERTRLLARSVAPVKSSAMQPSFNALMLCPSAVQCPGKS